MKRFAISAAVGVALLTASLCWAGTATAEPISRQTALAFGHACLPAHKGFATCGAEVVLDSAGRAAVNKPAATAKPSGFGPADIRSAYALSATAGAGRTVAVIDAYNDATAEADLAVYRKKFGLPACTSASGCFRKVNQTGGSTLPSTSAAWSTEISLDIDMVSAACGSCKILLVEATTSSMANLAAAVDYAATQQPAAISNSYRGPDSGQNAAYDHPGIAIVASAGDDGYGVGAPASYDSVVAVGGTSLKRSTNARGWTEAAWSDTGSGCSTLNAKPSWQTTITQCSGKAVADVSAVADPDTGVAVYDSTSYLGAAGWQVFGGTSAAAPIIAGVYAMSGRTTGYPAAYTWTHASGLNDVTTGTNGSCPSQTKKWCTGATGWDGPTGLGTPKGTTSF